MSGPGDDTSADEGVILEPLRQEERVDGSQEQKAEGKKLTQYMAAIFGKYQGLALIFPGHFYMYDSLLFVPCPFRAVVSKLLAGWK
jgi:hypothetical protein